MESTIKQRIIQFIKAKKLSQKRFEETVGLSNGFVNNIVKSIGAEKLFKISAAFPELNTEWLLTGEGEMLKEQPRPEQYDPRDVISYKQGAPYYDVDFQLGFDELGPQWNTNPEYLINIPKYNNATLWCNASGDSMEPEINNGDIVALQRVEDFRFLPFDNIYAIVTTNEMRTIKRIGKGSIPNSYRLIPTNKAYEEQDLPIDMILHVYKVLGCIKCF